MQKTAAKKKPELLAPAGNPEIALAAFDAGADAVYCGLTRFSARARANNFSETDLGRVIDFAHREGKKVYLAFNTLVWESELEDAVRTLASAARFQPDALIIQDWGILKICRERFPELTLHASTQMGLHNSAGIRFLKELGVKRAILERQLTLAELRELAAASPLELEVFIHGSLCCGLSGKCLLSASLFNASGNRGECRQPCRNCYETKSGRGTFLSPADLNGSDLLPELCRLGIASLKIEGRLRTADYVWKTCRAYRLLLDHPEDKSAEAEAKSLLETTPSRKNSAGFFDGGKHLVEPDRPGIFGKKIGIVEKATPSGLKIKASARFHIGDRLRLVSPKPGTDSRGFLLTRLFVNNKPVTALRSGETGFIAGDFSAPAGAELYKIGENGFDFTRRLAALPPFRDKIQLAIQLSAQKIIVKTGSFVWEKQIELQQAQKNPLTEQALEQAFLSGGPEDFSADKVEAETEGSLFCPVSVLKALRRSFWEAFSAFPKETFEQKQERICAEFLASWKKRENTPVPVPETLPTLVLPDFVPEPHLSAFKNKVNSQPAAVNSPHLWQILKENKSSFPIHVIYPIPVSNSEAAELVRGLGAISAEADPEVPNGEIESMRAHTALAISKPKDFHDIPLLRSRIPLPEGDWTGCLCVKFNQANGLWEIFRK